MSRAPGMAHPTAGSAMKRKSNHGIAGLAVLLALAGSSGEAWGLTDEEIFREFRFNFVNPGARAQGLGGAYVAAAADATAAEANPAALHYVSRYEVFVDYRSLDPEPSRLFPSPGLVLPDAMGSTADYQTTFERNDVDFVSFASFAFPFSLGGRRARLAVSRQQVVSAENSMPAGETFLDLSLASFPIIPTPAGPERYSVRNTIEGFVDAELVHYNLAFSFSVPDFSIGVTATLADFDMQSEMLSSSIDPEGHLNSVHPRVDTAGGKSDILFLTGTDDSDTDVTYAVGLHWHPDSVFGDPSPLRFGVVYRAGAELEVSETRSEFNFLDGEFQPIDDPFTNVLRVPDRWAVGCSYETEHWLFSADVERIQYSDLLERFETGVNFFTSDIIPDTFLDIDDLRYDVDDATVVHAGAEYNFSSRGSWTHFLRAGYYNAPDNKVRLVDLTTDDPNVEAIMLDLFRGGEDVNHYTVGFSLLTPARVQLDFAGDFSEAGDAIVASAIYRFGSIR
jgi:hypothetical protein